MPSSASRFIKCMTVGDNVVGKPEAMVRAKVSVVNEGAEQRKEKSEGSYAGLGGKRKSEAMVFMEEETCETCIAC